MGNNLRDGLNRNLPFFVYDYGYADITLADFDPITTEIDWTSTPAQFDDSRLGYYRANGFLARPNADGDFYAITWAQYHAAIQNPEGQTDVAILATLVPQLYNGVENQWVDCLLVKVFSHSDQTYGSTATSINIGIIL